MKRARGALRLVAAIGIAAAIGSPGTARANGRYPASGQISLDPTTEKTMLVRATYGLMLSTDAGKTWGWICETAVGYGGEEDPMMSFTASGTLLAGIFEGLSIGQPNGCSWQFASGADGGLAQKYVVDLAVDKVAPTNAVLIISNNSSVNDAGLPTFLTQLWQTSDNGQTWAQAGTTLSDQFLGLTVDTAPSNPMRVYASGRFQAPNYTGVIMRSDDRGATWQTLAIPGADMTHLPYIGAVDPTNPDVLYVRLDADPSDTLLVSKDGGMTWATIFTAQGKLNGFALSPDGTTIAIGSPGITGADGGTTSAGVWTAPSSSLVFTQTSPIGALCLTWGATGLYACANEYTDGFTAGVSSDKGKTFAPLLHLNVLCPLVCDDSTPVQQQCPAEWPSTESTIGASCPTDATGGSSSSSTTSSGSSSASGKPVASGSSGCSCSLAGTSERGALGVSLLGLAAGAVIARGRRRRSRSPGA